MGAELRCPGCGAPHYPEDRTYADRDCGTRVWFSEYHATEYGNQAPRRFRPGPNGSFPVPAEEGDDETSQAGLDDF